VAFPGGYIADRYGRKTIIVFATFANALCHLSYALALDWRYILLALVIGNLTRISNPALQAITADSIPPKKRGSRLLNPADHDGVDIYARASDRHHDLRLLRVRPGYEGRICLLSRGLLHLQPERLRLTETLENAERISLKEILLAFPRSYVASFKMLFTIPKALQYLILTNNIISFATSFFGSYIIVYATTDLGLSKPDWGIILTAQAVVTTLLVVPIGKAIDVIGAKIMMILFNLMLIATVLLTIYANFNSLLFIMPVMGIAFSANGVASQKLTAGLTQKNLRGKMAGLFRFFSLIVGGVSGLIGGLTYENTAHANVFIVGAVILLIGAIVLVWFVHPQQQEEL